MTTSTESSMTTVDTGKFVSRGIRKILYERAVYPAHIHDLWYMSTPGWTAADCGDLPAPRSGAEAQWPHGCYGVSRRELARAALRVLEVGPLIESGYSTTMLFPWRRRPRRRPAREARLLRQGIARETTRDHILRQQPESRVHPRGVAHEQVE